MYITAVFSGVAILVGSPSGGGTVANQINIHVVITEKGWADNDRGDTC